MFSHVIYQFTEVSPSANHNAGVSSSSHHGSSRNHHFSTHQSSGDQHQEFHHQPTGAVPSASPVLSDISSIRVTPRIPNSTPASANGTTGGGQDNRQHAFLEPQGVPIKLESQQNSRTLPPLASGPGSHAGSDIGDQLMPPGSAMSHYASSFNSLSPFPVEISPSGSSFASPRHSARSHSAKSRKRALSLSPLSTEGIDLNSMIRTSPTSLVAFINSRGGSSGSISPAVGLHPGDYGHLSARSSPMSQVSFVTTNGYHVTGGLPNSSKSSSPPPPPYQPPKMVTCGFGQNTFQEDNGAAQIVQEQMQQLEQQRQQQPSAVGVNAVDSSMNNLQTMQQQSQLIVQTREKALEEFTVFNTEYQQQQQQQFIKEEPMDTFQGVNTYNPQTDSGFAQPPNGGGGGGFNPTSQASYVNQDTVTFGTQQQQHTQQPFSQSQQTPFSSQPNLNFTGDTGNFPLPPAYSNHTSSTPFQSTSMPLPSVPPPLMPPPAAMTSSTISSIHSHPLPANMPPMIANIPPPPPYGQHMETSANHSPPLAITAQQQNSPGSNNNNTMKMENENDVVKICKWIDCNAMFEEQEDMVRHIEKVHIDQRKGEDFTCFWQACTRRYKPFNARYKLLIHMRVHSGEKPNKCTVSRK